MPWPSDLEDPLDLTLEEYVALAREVWLDYAALEFARQCSAPLEPSAMSRALIEHCKEVYRDRLKQFVERESFLSRLAERGR